MSRLPAARYANRIGGASGWLVVAACPAYPGVFTIAATLAPPPAWLKQRNVVLASEGLPGFVVAIAVEIRRADKLAVEVAAVLAPWRAKGLRSGFAAPIEVVRSAIELFTGPFSASRFDTVPLPPRYVPPPLSGEVRAPAAMPLCRPYLPDWLDEHRADYIATAPGGAWWKSPADQMAADFNAAHPVEWGNPKPVTVGGVRNAWRRIVQRHNRQNWKEPADA